MRILLVLLGATALTACGGGGGGGPETLGNIAPPPGAGGQASDMYSQVANPIDPKTYTGIGSYHGMDHETDARNSQNQQGVLYAGASTTVRDSKISVSYDPRDATFILTIPDSRNNVEISARFQDPAHRTNFGGDIEPQWGVNDFNTLPNGAASNLGVNFLQAGDGNPLARWEASGQGLLNLGDNDTQVLGADGSAYQATTFFYQKPGTTTKYVTFAGFVRNQYSFVAEDISGDLTLGTFTGHERGAFAYGAQTSNGAVPRTGSGSYSGAMIASLVFNPYLDTDRRTPTYFQWMVGTATHNVDFAKLSIASTLTGTVYAPWVERWTSGVTGLPANTRFDATANATIDLASRGGFFGSFNSASFTEPGSGGKRWTLNIAGSSIDGAFFGPNGEEIGGGFRVVGGTPDERIDILGAFTGKK